MLQIYITRIYCCLGSSTFYRHEDKLQETNYERDIRKLEDTRTLSLSSTESLQSNTNQLKRIVLHLLNKYQLVKRKTRNH